MRRLILLLALLGATLIFASSGIVLAASTTPDTAKERLKSTAEHTETQQDIPVASVAEGGNERIAFSNDATGDHDVYTMRPDGSDLKNLTNSPGVDDYHVHVSPDGSQIVFERAPTAGFEADIWVMNADGSGLHQITNHPANDRHPSWHPDGERIVFMSDRDAASPWPIGDMDLYVVNAADGSGLVRLTNASGDEARPKYSPSGTKISYTKRRDTGDLSGFSIHVMDSDGRNDRQITPDAMEAAGNDWSPDGNRIAFHDNFCIIRQPTCSSNIWVVKSNGKGMKQLTFDSGGAYNLEPTWSPDSRRLAFEHGADYLSMTDIYVMNTDGTGVTNVTETPTVHDFLADWGAD
jgi:TolB protein